MQCITGRCSYPYWLWRNEYVHLTSHDLLIHFLHKQWGAKPLRHLNVNDFLIDFFLIGGHFNSLKAGIMRSNCGLPVINLAPKFGTRCILFMSLSKVQEQIAKFSSNDVNISSWSSCLSIMSNYLAHFSQSHGENFEWIAFLIPLK